MHRFIFYSRTNPLETATVKTFGGGRENAMNAAYSYSKTLEFGKHVEFDDLYTAKQCAKFFSVDAAQPAMVRGSR